MADNEYIDIKTYGDFREHRHKKYLRILDCVIDFKLNNKCRTETWDMSKCPKIKSFFSAYENVPAGISGWDVSSCQNMCGTFAYCNFAPSVYLFGWDTSACKCMLATFRECEYIPDISGWDVSAVRTMEDMFRECINTKIPNISGWDTSACRNMNAMFLECLYVPNISAWKIKCNNLQFMFRFCYKLNQPLLLDLSIINTHDYIYNTTYDMFTGCCSLKI